MFVFVLQDIAPVIKLHAEVVKEILEQMSRFKPKTGWEFKLPYDSEFVHKYPDVVQRQNMLWDAKFKHLASVLKVTNQDQKMATQALTSSPPKRRRTVSRSRHKSSGDRSMSDFSDGDDVRAAGERRQRRLSSSAGARTTPGRRQRIRSSSGSGDRVTSGAASAPNTSTSVPPVNSNGSSLLPPKQEPTPTAMDTSDNNTENHNNEEAEQEKRRALTSFLRDKLRQCVVLKISDIRGLLSVELSSHPPGHILSRGVTDHLIDDVIPSADGLRVLSAQLQCNEAVYVLKCRGDERDVIRASFVDRAQKQNKCTVAQLRQAVADVTPDHKFNKDDFRKVLDEYCDRKGSVYYLKNSTNS